MRKDHLSGWNDPKIVFLRDNTSYQRIMCISRISAIYFLYMHLVISGPCSIQAGNPFEILILILKKCRRSYYLDMSSIDGSFYSLKPSAVKYMLICIQLLLMCHICVNPNIGNRVFHCFMVSVSVLLTVDILKSFPTLTW